MPLSVVILLVSAATLAGVFLVVWWLMDHRRGTAWAISVVRDRFPDVNQISVENLKQWLRDDSRARPVVIDARSSEENSLSHLPAAIHLDPGSTPDEILQALDPGRDYVVYCSAGYRACRLARRMRAAGIPNVSNLEGGIFAWANAGQPLVKGEVPATAVHPCHPFFSRLLRPERRPH